MAGSGPSASLGMTVRGLRDDGEKVRDGIRGLEWTVRRCGMALGDWNGR